MTKFLPVAPEDIPNVRDGHRGRVSYPILKDFLESGMPIAQLDRSDMKQSVFTLNSTLGMYVRTHGLPIKIFVRRGQIYLARTDLDEMGNIKQAANGQQVPVVPEEELAPLDAAEVARRYAEAGGDTTR